MLFKKIFDRKQRVCFSLRGRGIYRPQESEDRRELIRPPSTPTQSIMLYDNVINKTIIMIIIIIRNRIKLYCRK